MSPEDIKKYIIHCCGNETCASNYSNDRIQSEFDQFGTELSDFQDRLSCQGFLDFYRQACIDRPDAVRSDLKVFDFDYEVKDDEYGNPSQGLLINRKLTEPARNAFKSMFEQFATNENGTMSIEDMKKYILFCDGWGIFYRWNIEIEIIQDQLSCEEFLDFYRWACMAGASCQYMLDYVWNDLGRFNFGYDLRKKSTIEKHMKPIILDEEICQSEHSETVIWTFSDDQVVKIKGSESRDIIKSKVLTMNGLKFQIWLYVCDTSLLIYIIILQTIMT